MLTMIGLSREPKMSVCVFEFFIFFLVIFAQRQSHTGIGIRHIYRKCTHHVSYKYIGMGVSTGKCLHARTLAYSLKYPSKPKMF